MSKKCLLLRFPDNREVFTYEKYLSNLEELSKSFGVKILPVEADHPSLLKPKEIVKFFCDQSKENISTCSYRIINKNNMDVGAREKMLQKVCDVRSYIESQLLEGNIVRIKELHHRFIKHNVAVSTLYRHLSYVKNKLKNQGKTIIKISAGCYQLDSAV